MPPGMAGHPFKHLIAGRRRFLALQHGAQAVCQRRQTGCVPADRRARQQRRRSLGEDTGAGIVDEGSDPSILQPQFHLYPVTTGRIVGASAGVGSWHVPGPISVGYQPQQITAIEGVRLLGFYMRHRFKAFERP